ncbi:hypothetical protein FRC02_003845 [Tulasnella sp. 418]|nr:hypothetical protein FRC02_003845 [Tulasnella sp. 418]
MKILILPLTLLVGQIVCCAVTVAYEAKAQKAFWYIPRKNQWLTSVFIISLLVNITVMGLMCLRIHRVSRSVSDLSPAANTLYKHIFQIFIEGGALYGAVLVVALILQGVKLYSCSLMVNFLTPQIIGVVPTLIVLRLLLQTTFQSRRSTGDDTAPSTSQQKTITQPVFAHMTAGDTTRLSEFRRSMQFQGYPITSMSDKYWPDDFSGGAVQ